MAETLCLSLSSWSFMSVTSFSCGDGDAIDFAAFYHMDSILFSLIELIHFVSYVFIYFSCRNKQSKAGVVCDGCTFSCWEDISWQFHYYTIIKEMGVSCHLLFSFCDLVWRTHLFFELISSNRRRRC